MNILYEIDGTENRDQNPVYDNPNFTTFQAHLVQFKWLLKDLVKKGESKTFYKFGDGDYFFLRGESVGSASPGKRALSKSYSDIKHEEFVSGVCENDYVNVELYNRDLFRSLYPDRQINFNAEYGYGLVANCWLTKTFSESIGVIGASQKVKLIEKLMEKKEYQEYLGLSKFQDYISIPQKFACDDIDATEKMIAEQLKNSTSKIFLLGVGHVKSALLHRLKKYRDAVFLDVGSGIDALAGIIDHNRPYMGEWVNHRIQGFDYDSLDILQYDIWNTPYKMME
jgi:hypothetical protein